MADFESILDFLEPVILYELSDDEGYKDTQLGKHIAVNDEYFPDLENADMVIVGFGETRALLLLQISMQDQMLSGKSSIPCFTGIKKYM